MKMCLMTKTRTRAGQDRIKTGTIAVAVTRNRRDRNKGNPIYRNMKRRSRKTEKEPTGQAAEPPYHFWYL